MKQNQICFNLYRINIEMKIIFLFFIAFICGSKGKAKKSKYYLVETETKTGRSTFMFVKNATA